MKHLCLARNYLDRFFRIYPRHERGQIWFPGESFLLCICYKWQELKIIHALFKCLHFLPRLSLEESARFYKSTLRTACKASLCRGAASSKCSWREKAKPVKPAIAWCSSPRTQIPGRETFYEGAHRLRQVWPRLQTHNIYSAIAVDSTCFLTVCLWANCDSKRNTLWTDSKFKFASNHSTSKLIFSMFTGTAMILHTCCWKMTPCRSSYCPRKPYHHRPQRLFTQHQVCLPIYFVFNIIDIVSVRRLTEELLVVGIRTYEHAHVCRRRGITFVVCTWMCVLDDFVLAPNPSPSYPVICCMLS